MQNEDKGTQGNAYLDNDDNLKKFLGNMTSAKIIEDSYNHVFDSRIITFELEYPRIIHSEFMTHRLFSRNASSSRAIPIEKVIEQVINDPASPVEFGKNKPGMKASELTENLIAAYKVWVASGREIASFATVMKDMKLHKQVVNRILEPWQFIKVVMTTTNLNNFFELRNHPDADPTIQQLAKKMLKEVDDSQPTHLHEGQWHMPYVHNMLYSARKQKFFDVDGSEIDLKDALKISASCCAQVSYRKLDTSLEKAYKIYDMLINSKPAHSSPVEHAATPIAHKYHKPMEYFDIKGVTHVDKNRIPWSGNFHGWVQNRQLIPENAVPY